MIVGVAGVALPVRRTLAAANPVTDSLKVTVKRMGDAFVGSAWPVFWLTVTVGGVVSRVAVSLSVPVLPAVSWTDAATVRDPSSRPPRSRPVTLHAPEDTVVVPCIVADWTSVIVTVTVCPLVALLVPEMVTEEASAALM